MAQRRLSMRKIREIVRLRLETASGLSMEAIGRACKVSSSTVQDTLARFKRSGLSWPLPPEITDASLERLLYKDEQKFQSPADNHEPDWAWVHHELRKGKNVTLAVVWEEYR